MLFKPKMYRKNIYDIDYNKLKKLNIKLLIFDLDNTICLIDDLSLSKEIYDLFSKLHKSFEIVIISNNHVPRVKNISDKLKCDYKANSMKPLLKSYKKILKKYNLKPNEVAMIGDQIVTDILGANRMKIYSILVDPMSYKDLKITKLNRFIERQIFKKYQKKHIMNRGEYYG